MTNPFRIDARAITVTRCLLAIWILIDVALRAPDLAAHYSDEGVLPRSTLIDAYLRDGAMFSLFNSNGSALVAGGLFVAIVASAITFLVGYRTFLSNAILWLLVLSLHMRNPMILNAGDHIVRILLFWCLLLPMAGSWSLDKAPASSRLRGFAASFVACAIFIQLALIYVTNGVTKTGPDWNETHTAVLRSLRLDVFVTPVGRWFAEFPEALKVMTRGLRFFECLLPVLLFVPFAKSRLRIVGFAIALAFHLGIALMLGIWALSAAVLILWVLTLPASFWDGVGSFVRKPGWLSDRTEDRAELDAEPAVGLRFGAWVARAGVFAVAASTLAMALAGNLHSMTKDKGFAPPLVRNVSRFLGVEQGWNMFAPAVLGVDRWPVLRAQLSDGSVVDLFRNGGPIRLQKPRTSLEGYPNLRWLTFFSDAFKIHSSRIYGDVCQSFVRGWNREHSDRRVLDVTLIVLHEHTDLDGSESPIVTDEYWKISFPPPNFKPPQLPSTPSLQADSEKRVPWGRKGAGAERNTPDDDLVAIRKVPVGLDSSPAKVERASAGPGFATFDSPSEHGVVVPVLSPVSNLDDFSRPDD